MTPEEEKKAARAPFIPIVAAVCGTALLFAAMFAISRGLEAYVHYFGATPQDIATVGLEQTLKALEHKLPCTGSSPGKVTTSFRHTVVGFERATFTWDEAAYQVTGIKLWPVRSHEGKHERARAPRALADKLDDLLPGVDGEKRTWGAVTFHAEEDAGLSFEVAPKSPLLARQVEAARQVLVAVAFDISPTLSDKDLADLLGSGYALADIAKLDPVQPKAAIIAAIRARFPATVADGNGVDVPLRHPLLSAIRLEWPTFGGRVGPLRVSFTTRRSFDERRDAFVRCLTSKTSASKSRVRTLRFGTLEEHGIELEMSSHLRADADDAGLDAGPYAAMLAAIEACGA